MTLFATLDRVYDAIPRQSARAEEIGAFTLFVPEPAGPGLYARPTLGAGIFEPADVEAVRDRQRELGLPEAFEWLPQCAPLLLPVIESAGLHVLHAPLMVLDPAALPAGGDARVSLLDPAAPNFAALVRDRRAVAAVAFAQPGVAVGVAGPAQRDAAAVELAAAGVAREVDWADSGRGASAVAVDPVDGIVASGAYQRAADVVEIVGVATLPSARRRGLGGAVTAALARRALELGAGTVFLSAADERVARVYAKLGFTRVGTACVAESPDQPM